MNDIKMSDVFNPLSIVTGRDLDTWELQDTSNSIYAIFYDHETCINAAKAIGTYDADQERIAELENFILVQAENCFDEIDRDDEIIRPKVDAHNIVYKVVSK